MCPEATKLPESLGLGGGSQARCRGIFVLSVPDGGQATSRRPVSPNGVLWGQRGPSQSGVWLCDPGPGPALSGPGG